MAGTLPVILVFVMVYTIFAPVFTLDVKHLKYGLLMLFGLGVFAFILYLTHQL